MCCVVQVAMIVFFNLFAIEFNVVCFDYPCIYISTIIEVSSTMLVKDLLPILEKKKQVTAGKEYVFTVSNNANF